MKADQLSQTAAFLAIKFYGLSRFDSFRSLFDDSVIIFYERLVKTLPAPNRYYHFWLQFRWVRKLYIWSEELLLPGDLLHVVARKWYIHRMVKKSIAEGSKQLIVLGAGFDHLAHHYSQQDIYCIECDVPYMAKRKKAFLRQFYPNSQHPLIVEAFLPKDQLVDIFENHPEVDPNKKTTIVAEGFFDYLNSNTVHSLLKGLKQHFTSTPTLISTHFDLNELFPFHQHIFKSSVKLVGEELQLQKSINEFKDLLSEIGYRLNRHYDCQTIREEITKHCNTDLPLLSGFHILQLE
ncbi:class I SAM-dependent methyltransferase [Fodinibius saliphilus]|uniref:class I SAM-dependent methyltransferase n=1 Tax=Fodinibius saliphilus TaxID=1920650 RepID=UPI001108CFD5|nr:class I SAM-dependent methyltransferase [Fodinibius saliphilus]